MNYLKMKRSRSDEDFSSKRSRNDDNSYQGNTGNIVIMSVNEMVADVRHVVGL